MIIHDFLMKMQWICVFVMVIIHDFLMKRHQFAFS